MLQTYCVNVLSISDPPLIPRLFQEAELQWPTLRDSWISPGSRAAVAHTQTAGLAQEAEWALGFEVRDVDS